MWQRQWYRYNVRSLEKLLKQAETPFEPKRFHKISSKPISLADSGMNVTKRLWMYRLAKV